MSGTSIPFRKMNGLGNDFVVVEARSAPFAPSADEVRAIANRERGIGCDQLVSIEPSANADAKVRFWNADGDEVGACGNASRCVGWLLMEASGRDQAVLETQSGLLTAGSVFVAADTWVGPFYFAYGRTSGGQSSFYLYLGRP